MRPQGFGRSACGNPDAILEARLHSLAMTRDPSDVPDARDGLTRKERIILRELAKLQGERAGRGISLVQLYGRVLEHIDLSQEELRALVAKFHQRAK